MKPNCREIPCRCEGPRLKIGQWVSKGRFYRKSDSRFIHRWECKNCRFTFSESTFHPCFGQNKRRVNEVLYRLICSGVSLRRSALILGVHRITVHRKLSFLAQQARLNQRDFWKKIRETYGPLNAIQFDEMETFEHTKLKPVSIALAVSPGRRILGAFVASMPAKGLLAKKSVDKYGPRQDRRPAALSALLRSIKPLVTERVVIHSDQNPHYPRKVFRHFPQARHVTTPGLRGCVVGQGELKAAWWDPLFALNHTAAMFRANMNRLFRRTWCTTKTMKGLKDHLALYIDFHNQLLIKREFPV